VLDEDVDVDVVLLLRPGEDELAGRQERRRGLLADDLQAVGRHLRELLVRHQAELAGHGGAIMVVEAAPQAQLVVLPYDQRRAGGVERGDRIVLFGDGAGVDAEFVPHRPRLTQNRGSDHGKQGEHEPQRRLRSHILLLLKDGRNGSYSVGLSITLC
jgi:hypothetical protein